MVELTFQLLLTDALLLDAIEGLESIASRLIELHDNRVATSPDSVEVASLARVLTDLGWWSGRLAGAVSPETTRRLEGLSSGGS